MATTLEAESPPLHEDESGALRVGNSRVLFDLVIEAHRDGLSPEQIVEEYPALTLPDAYGAIAYYLRHTERVEEYLTRRSRELERVWEEINQRQGSLAEIRERVAAFRKTSIQA